MSNKFFLYGHNGSGNHGCEAIVRATAKILKNTYYNAEVKLASNGVNEDRLYGLDKIVEVVDEKTSSNKLSIPFINAYFTYKVLKNGLKLEKLPYRKNFNNLDKQTIALSIGGDNYCYPGWERFKMLNNMLQDNNIKTVLWGCSVEPSNINDEMAEDLRKYDLIITRETLTLKALEDIGAKVKLYPDPAFQLDKVEKELPKGFIDKDTVGINISPMIMKNESTIGITMKNYIKLIEYILDNTKMNVALIPHVIWEDNNDDRVPSRELYNKFKNTGRIIIIEDNNCEVLKGYISRCRIFIGARTHSTIAAYSTCVPTLVVGYSIKAKGIANDIFGSYENYVLPVQALNTDNDLTLAFKWLKDREKEVKAHLKEFMPGYCLKSYEAAKEISNLIR